MKLRGEIKKGLAIVFGVMVVVIMIISIETSTNKAVAKCVESGQDRAVCERGLR